MDDQFPSNKAIPQYYEAFRSKVMSGEIPVSREISQEMNRIDARIDDPEIFFDPRPVEAFIRFCENELTLTDGSPLKLLDSFKLWGEQLFGWYYYAVKSVYDGSDFVEIEYLKRLISKQYLIVARGGAKSMYASCVQAYFLVIDGETTHQIATAPTMKQAEETLSPINTAITRAPGPLFKFLTTPVRGLKFMSSNYKTMLTRTKKGIESFITSSLLEIRPMSINKLQGLRPKISTVDEWLSGDLREDVIGAIEQGASKLNDWIIVAVSSEGTVRNGSGDDIKLELQRILNGEYDDPHTSIFYYRLDDVSEVGDPKMWVKAQPNIGLTVSYEAYHRDVLRAQHAPATRNDILAKRFNIPMEGRVYYFTYEETIPHRLKSYREMNCALGVDLSQGDDFCSFTFLFPIRGNRFGVKSLSFISERTLKLLPTASRIKYETFIDEGSLVISGETVLDMEAVFYTLYDYIIENEFTPVCMGYDPYNADMFVKLYKEHFGPYGVEKVRQGARTESVPLGEIKKLAADRVLLFDEDIFSFAMTNTMVLEDTNGNRKLYKRRYEHKIDPVSALMDAYVVYSQYLDMFE